MLRNNADAHILSLGYLWKNRLQISIHVWVTAFYNKSSNDDRGAIAVVEMTILASGNRLV